MKTHHTAVPITRCTVRVSEPSPDVTLFGTSPMPGPDWGSTQGSCYASSAKPPPPAAAPPGHALSSREPLCLSVATCGRTRLSPQASTLCKRTVVGPGACAHGHTGAVSSAQQQAAPRQEDSIRRPQHGRGRHRPR